MSYKDLLQSLENTDEKFAFLSDVIEHDNSVQKVVLEKKRHQYRDVTTTDNSHEKQTYKRGKLETLKQVESNGLLDMFITQINELSSNVSKTGKSVNEQTKESLKNGLNTIVKLEDFRLRLIDFREQLSSHDNDEQYIPWILLLNGAIDVYREYDTIVRNWMNGIKNVATKGYVGNINVNPLGNVLNGKLRQKTGVPLGQINVIDVKN